MPANEKRLHVMMAGFLLYLAEYTVAILDVIQSNFEFQT